MNRIKAKLNQKRNLKQTYPGKHTKMCETIFFNLINLSLNIFFTKANINRTKAKLNPSDI